MHWLVQGFRAAGQSGSPVLFSRSAWPPALAQVAPPTESAPDLEEGPDPSKRRPWFDRQGIIQAHAGFVVALIALLSSYDHISFPAGIRFQLQQQWGVWFIVASMALVVADAQLATQSRHREADQRLEAANEAARERDRAAEERIRSDRERNRAAEERILASEERDRADRERNRADRERKRAALRAQQQARCNRVQLCHQLDPNEANAQRVRDLISLLDEYGGLA